MFEKKNREITMTQNLRQTPLTCSGHTRPVVFLSFSEFNPEDEANYYSISACKGKFSFLSYIWNFLKDVLVVFYCGIVKVDTL